MEHSEVIIALLDLNYSTRTNFFFHHIFIIINLFPNILCLFLTNSSLVLIIEPSSSVFPTLQMQADCVYFAKEPTSPGVCVYFYILKILHFLS